MRGPRDAADRTLNDIAVTCAGSCAVRAGERRMEAAHPGELWLHLTADMPADAAVVFDALTDPQQISQWWGPHHFTTSVIDVDLRVGGRFRFAMQPPERELFHLQGEFVEIAAPHRLAYTFRWEEPDPDDVDTVVTLALNDRGAASRLVVQQGAFATPARHELHRQGWSESLERLESWLSSE